jgi:hypothetical protein
MQFLILYMM